MLFDGPNYKNYIFSLKKNKRVIVHKMKQNEVPQKKLTTNEWIPEEDDFIKNIVVVSTPVIKDNNDIEHLSLIHI